MGRTILAVCMSGLLTAACAPPSLGDQVGERVLIRNGFVVPSGNLLLVDDISVDCVIAGEVFDEAEFHKVGVEFDSVPAHRLIRPMPVPRPSTRKASARHRTTWSAPQPHMA